MFYYIGHRQVGFCQGTTLGVLLSAQLVVATVVVSLGEYLVVMNVARSLWM
jgi:hypothetical protein